MLTARKHCVIFILFTISLVTCVEVGATKNSAKSKFFENWREGTILKKGKNMNATSDQTASSVHPSNAGNNYVGVALNIRNQSPFRLAQPMVYKYCGYEVVNFSNMNIVKILTSWYQAEPDDVNPGFEEVFHIHNKEKWSVSTCGAIAWQVGIQT